MASTATVTTAWEPARPSGSKQISNTDWHCRNCRNARAPDAVPTKLLSPHVARRPRRLLARIDDIGDAGVVHVHAVRSTRNGEEPQAAARTTDRRLPIFMSVHAGVVLLAWTVQMLLGSSKSLFMTWLFEGMRVVPGRGAWCGVALALSWGFFFFFFFFFFFWLLSPILGSVCV
ncbi:hypothetical protein BKA81DRAFT_116489 [Phyllosticta paracitricarpa]|uniref:Uncharacterized protein n=1 Tax=Phyllosticta paracitricarpa TaxID=2016321 RepID=A0ABR1MYQ3_9PEZI